MDVHILGWIGLAVAVIALISTDIIGHVRKPHAPSMKEATAWTLGYVALAVVFGLAIWVIYGASYAIQFYSGYMMEWSLSLDNLFVFVIIMASFKVPRDFQQKALLAGIIQLLHNLQRKFSSLLCRMRNTEHPNTHFVQTRIA